jgi:parallel beta-helix repeat protein
MIKRIILLNISIVTLAMSYTYLATTPQEIQDYTNMLQAGDTLLVQNGHYDMTWNISNRDGNSGDWIVIEALGNVVIDGNAYDNVIDVYDCHYIELRGFEITNSYAGSGIDGIKFRTTSDHFIMEDLQIHDITGVGISANPGGQSFTYLTIRYCHIHDITDVGEGLYIGNHDGLSSVHHCLVEFNWIHDCHPHKGIQFKRSTYLNLIQDNVVYNCDEAGIVLYKTDQSSSADNNIVRRNVIWNAPEGIFAVGQTDIDNNVIFDCSYGINVRNYGSWGMEDLYIRNNTIYHCNTTCLRLDDWNNATGEMICLNNACFQDSLSYSAIQVPDGLGPGYAAFNQHYGQSQLGSGSTLGNPPAQEFVNASIVPGTVDLYPLNSATLIDSGTSQYNAPDDDFNWWFRPVNSQWDVGAYEWSQNANPGWQVQEGFKEIYIGQEENKAIVINQSQIAPTISHQKVYFNNLDNGDVIKIYDCAGKLSHIAGNIVDQHYTWQTSNVASGVYFYVIEQKVQKRIIPGKIVLIH